LNILISKNDKNLPFLGLKTLLEEIFIEVLIIKDYNDLNNYNLPLFPQEVVVIYYENSMENHNKYHHLIYNSKYSIIINEYSWSYENENIMTIGYNINFINWFFNKTINYFKEKYKLNFSINDEEKKLAINWIISKKYDPLKFYKTIFFIGKVTDTINYVNSIDSNLIKIKHSQYETPFMEFYKIIMNNYGGKCTMESNELLAYIILFNNIFISN
jgi:hypothetical protein